MRKKDYDNWLNEHQSDDEAERFEAEMMGHVFTHRLKNQLAERLKAQRLRRRFFRWGLFSVTLLALGGAALWFAAARAVSAPTLPSVSSAQNAPEAVQNTVVEPQSTAAIERKLPVRDQVAPPQPEPPNAFKTPELPPVVAPNAAPLKWAPTRVDTEYTFLQNKREPFEYPSTLPVEERDHALDILDLDWSRRRLVALPPSVFFYKNLKNLDLSGNRLTDLPAELAQLDKIAALSLRKNRFKTVPETVFKLPQLTTLDLMGNRLKTLPDAVSRLTQLSRLNLDHNECTTLPESLAQCAGLVELSAQGNFLRDIPPVVWRLKSLETLNWAGNRVETLPENIAELANLKSLRLQRNALRDIPAEIGQLTQLTYLDLSDNDLRELPQEIESLTRLKTLVLRNNPIALSEIRRIELWLPNCRVEW